MRRRTIRIRLDDEDLEELRRQASEKLTDPLTLAKRLVINGLHGPGEVEVREAIDWLRRHNKDATDSEMAQRLWGLNISQIIRVARGLGISLRPERPNTSKPQSDP